MAVIVSELMPCVNDPVVANVNVVPALDAPLIVVTPLAVSLIFALVAAFAVMFATFVLNAFASDDPPMPPLVEVRFRFVAYTVPVMLLLNRLL